MATPTAHALLSASSSERWLNCTAAPRYEQQFPPSGGTKYTAEGSLAHEFCEAYGRYHFNYDDAETFSAKIDTLKKNAMYNPEMLKTAEFYVQFLSEKYMSFKNKPMVSFETRVNFSEYVPDGFGTCDCIMVDDTVLRITDYKHGQGVPVSSINNSQMRLYALGALKYYEMIVGKGVKQVVTAIVQPRITEDVTEEWLTVEELKAWGETVKVKAQKAFTGVGAEFNSGDWCKFCAGKAVCAARAAKNSAFEDFKDLIPATATPKTETQRAVLSNEQVSDLLTRAAALVEWYKDLQEYAQQAILAGQAIPGWKVVAGKSNRAFTDEEKVKSVLTRKGHIKATDLYEPRKMKSLATLEKMIGKAEFAELVGEYIVKPLGKPALVPESDKRPAYSSAAADFAGVSND